MGQPAIIRHGLVSAEEMAEIFGIPVSRVKTIEQALLRSRQKKTRSAGNIVTKKLTTRSKTGKKRSAAKAE
jgi:hypothetical protein